VKNCVMNVEMKSGNRLRPPDMWLEWTPDARPLSLRTLDGINRRHDGTQSGALDRSRKGGNRSS
jgi:hypothetical protein